MSAPLVLNDRGLPEPPADLQRRLRQIHDRLCLRYVQAADAVWAVCVRWDEHDPRFGNVQSQVLDPDRAFDIVGYLPKDCSLNEAPAYLARMFRQYPKETIQQFANGVDAFNKSVVSTAADRALGEVLDQKDPSGTLPKLTRPKRR